MKFLKYIDEAKKRLKTVEDALNFFYPHQDFIFIYHETPIKNVASIVKTGLRDESNFATIDTPSNFVITKDKAIIKISIPKRLWRNLSPDMRYEPEDALNDLLSQHPRLKGADVSYNDEIPVKMISSIKIIKNGKTKTLWPAQFKDYKG